MTTLEPMTHQATHCGRAVAVVAAALTWTWLMAVPLGGHTDRSPGTPQIPNRKPLDQACHVFKSDGALTISVLGDSTGNDSNEWPAFLAQRMAEDHRVTMLRWNDSTELWDRAPLRYGERGSAVRIWNFSAPGRTPSYASMRLKRAVPEPPDLILFSYGHNNNPGDIEEQYEALFRQLGSLWGKRAATVVILQNPELGLNGASQTEVRATIERFAARTGVPIIDVAKGFAAETDLASLMADQVHPNERGARLWARTVSSSLCMT